MKITISILFIASLLLMASSLDSAIVPGEEGGGVSPAPESPNGVELEKWCGGKCEVRCKEAGMKDRCLKYCGICCKECKCVPSGTYGNKHECACYRDKLSSKNTPKCP